MVALVVVLLAGELGARLSLSSGQRALLPRVGLREEAQARWRWLERHRAQEDSRAYEFDLPDLVLGWRVRPGLRVRSVKPDAYDVMVTTNPQGLRGAVPVSDEKTAGRARVGIFGCSLTFGEGVGDDDTYSARLAAELPEAEILNFGVHGYGTDQMLLRYETEGVRYKLDVVVLAFAGFQISRNVSAFTFYAKPRFELGADGALRLTGTPVPSPAELTAAGVGDLSLPLADASVLLRWSWQRVRNLRARMLYRPDGDGWRLTRVLIARLAADARAAGAQMVLLNVDENFPQLEEPLAKLAADLSIEFVNVAPTMLELQRAGVRYRLGNDNHWNATGHRALAAYLRQRLCETVLRAHCGGQGGPPTSAADFPAGVLGS